MPFLITALMRSTNKKTTRKNSKQQKICKNKIFTAETQYIILKAHSNNVKMQSDKTLTPQI